MQVMGDRTGSIRWWDVVTGLSSSFSTRRGPVRRIKFAPVRIGDSTRGRIAVLFNDHSFAVYDLVSTTQWHLKKHQDFSLGCTFRDVSIRLCNFSSFSHLICITSWLLIERVIVAEAWSSLLRLGHCMQDTHDPIACTLVQPHLGGVLVLELDWYPLRPDKNEPLLLCIAGADGSFRLLEVQK